MLGMPNSKRRRLNVSTMMDQTHRSLKRLISIFEGSSINIDDAELTRQFIQISHDMQSASDASDASDASASSDSDSKLAVQIIDDVIHMLDLMAQGRCPRVGHERLVDIACIGFSMVSGDRHSTDASDSLWKVIQMGWDLLDAADKCVCPCDDCKSTAASAATMSSFVSSVTPLVTIEVPETNRWMTSASRWQSHQNYDDEDEEEEEEEEFVNENDIDNLLNLNDGSFQESSTEHEHTTVHTEHEYSEHEHTEHTTDADADAEHEHEQHTALALFQQYITPILRASDLASSSMLTLTEIEATRNGRIIRTAIFSRFLPNDDSSDVLRIDVDRKDLLVSTFKSIESRISTLETWSRSLAPRVSVKFADESGYGDGVMRDWITNVMTAIYSPEAGIFRQVAHRVVHPVSSECSINDRIESVATRSKWGWLAGFVTGIAARANVSTGYHLSDAFASLVLGRRPTDLNKASIEIDNDIAATCRKTLEASPEDLNSMGLTFEYQDCGLLPDGSGQDIHVTAYNRDLFAKLVSARICGTDDVQGTPASIARGFRKGFLQGVGHSSQSSQLWTVTVEDFNMTLGGRLEITSEDILSKVQFCQERNVNRQRAEELIERFKQHVCDMSDDKRRALLRFWTGSLAPIGRSVNMQLVVIEDHGECRRPYSHTCYQQLTIPMAETTVETLAYLDEAIANCEAIVD